MKIQNPSLQVLWDLLLISIGSLIFAIGVQGVLVHHKFIIGGLFGTGLLVYYKTGLLSPGLWFSILNVPLMILGWFFFSKRFFFYSLYCVGLLTLCSELVSLDFAIHDQLYAAIAGGVICGTGVGIILRSRGSSGGLDIVAILLNQKLGFGVGKFYMLYNIGLFSAIASQYDIDLVIASLILTVTSSYLVEQVLALFNQRKVVYILSEKYQEIVTVITRDMHQGATLINAQGAYSGREKQMVMTVTNNLQLKRLEEKVFSLDPDGLFIVENSFNVIGSNFGKRKSY